MARRELELSLDLERDAFALWIRWVSMPLPEGSENDQEPSDPGIRAEFQINRESVWGPKILRKAEIPAQGTYVLVPAAAVSGVLRRSQPPSFVDLQLVIHGSVANAPFLALYLVRDRDPRCALSEELRGTPLLQLQPSVPGDRWQVAGQANLRLALRLEAPRGRLKILR